MNTIRAIALCVSIASLSANASAQPQTTEPTPFGIRLGVTTCNEAAKLLGGEAKPTPSGHAYLVLAKQPGKLFAGSTQVSATCGDSAEEVVGSVDLFLGEDDTSFLWAFNALSKQLPLVAVGKNAALFRGAGMAVKMSPAPWVGGTHVQYFSERFFTVRDDGVIDLKIPPDLHTH